jgi:hypothetical protein
MSKNSQRTSIPCFKTWLGTIRPKSDILPQTIINEIKVVRPMYRTFKRR